MPTTQAPPVLNWQPGGGTPIWTPAPPPAGHAPPENGLTALTIGQNYVDVVFVTTQPRADWTFAGLEVVNVTDTAPLNIWVGVATSKTRNGFRVYLNGLPDTGNYYLDWSINGGTVADAGTATTYLLSGPDSGPISSPTTFTVALPLGATVEVPVTVTPDDGGVPGTFSPATVELTSDMPSANFVYTPGSYGARTITVTNDSLLTDPGGIAFTSVVGTYLLSGPSGGVSGVASTNFTVALPVGGVTLNTITVTPDDGGFVTPGTFTPNTVNLTTAAPSATFTYTPATSGAKTISVTNNRGLTDPGSLTYTATVPGLADGDPVSTWRDSSVNGNDATMTGSNRPTFKTAIVNGKPVVRFTVAGSSKLNLTTPISGAQPWIVFSVMKQATGTSRIDALDGSDAGQPRGTIIATGGGFYMFTREGFEQSTTPVSLAFHIFDGIKAGAGSGADFIQVDGALATITFSASANTGNFTTIGYDSSGPTYCDGDIAEIIIYAAALSGTDRQNIEKYLGTKYGISVPAGTAVQPDTVSGIKGWWKADSL